MDNDHNLQKMPEPERPQKCALTANAYFSSVLAKQTLRPKGSAAETKGIRHERIGTIKFGISGRPKEPHNGVAQRE